MAKAVRARRALEEAALRGRRRTDANAEGARADVPMSDEQIAGVAECLNRHEVEYVLVGGGAAQLHGAPVMRTRDVDVVPSKSDDNLDRLSAALREMNARVWVGPNEPDGLAMAFDRGTLGQIEGFLNLVTSFGPLDVTYRPDGTGGYADLAQSVVIVKLLGVDVPIASLEDIIRSKEAAGRPKDIAVLPALIEHSRRPHSEP
ncbi:MAG: hypothetical protein NVS1B4_26990 [Gemmatimonadaceae bacterium]